MMSLPFRVARCELGLGIFATHFIRQGATILSFMGPLVDVAAVLAKGDRSGDVVQVDRHRYIDPEPPGLYVNHSCDPNAGIRDGSSLVAVRPIWPGEQICFDYSTTMLDRLWSMACRCRSPDCRGTVLDFDLLPTHVAHRYLALGIVQPFIAREFNVQATEAAGDYRPYGHASRVRP